MVEVVDVLVVEVEVDVVVDVVVGACVVVVLVVVDACRYEIFPVP